MTPRSSGRVGLMAGSQPARASCRAPSATSRSAHAARKTAENIAHLAPVRRAVLRRAARSTATAATATTAAGFRSPQDMVAAFRPEARRPRARRRLRQGLPGQGPDEGLPGARGVRPRHLGVRADALRAGGRRTAASRQRRRAAVPRRQLQRGDLAQHHPQLRPRRMRSRALREIRAARAGPRLRAGRFLSHARSRARSSRTGC